VPNTLSIMFWSIGLSFLRGTAAGVEVARAYSERKP
jgi:hypothetical protein